MGAIEGAIAWAVQLIKGLIQATGYPGIFVLMTLGGMCLPVSREVILPFAGALVGQGRLVLFGEPLADTLMIALIGTLGCTFGAVFAYYAGLKGGRPLILRYGRYLRLNARHLEATERWFARYGDWAVLGCRMIPTVRTLISIPAGMAKMNLKKFVILTAIGSLPLNLALAYLGLGLGENWQVVESLYRPMETLAVTGLVVILVYCLWKRRAARKDRPAV